jgi:hypothetical protein
MSEPLVYRDDLDVRNTAFTNGDGRRVLRRELLGREGGIPPILILFEDFQTGELLGTYRCSQHGHTETSGPMFEKHNKSTV